ncbi:hypothetical protein C8035_v012075 [Colletotrichum spinosum]|uniref:LWamide neuropeptide n=1 Tax=Colletotrichum spinosum TaxID=1347390 RepID=A0A4R8PWE6_9PEZI|nr:hypothetical protein C8035_v012075 [Colletotrichum spinosum]
MKPAVIAALLASSVLALPTPSRSQESIERELDELNASEPWEKREAQSVGIYGGKASTTEEVGINKRQSVGIYGGKASSTDSEDINKRQSVGIYGGKASSTDGEDVEKRQSVGIYGGKASAETDAKDNA